MTRKMKKLKKKIDVFVEKTDTGYSAYAEDQGAFTTSENIPSLYENLLEALNLHYEELGYLVAADNLRLR